MMVEVLNQTEMIDSTQFQKAPIPYSSSKRRTGKGIKKRKISYENDRIFLNPTKTNQ